MSPELADDQKLLETIGFDVTFTRRLLRAETFVWGAIGAFLIIGLLGALGRGLFSRALIERDHPAIQIRYERIVRTKTPALMEILAAAPGTESRLSVTLEGATMRNGVFQKVTPEPLIQRPTPAGMELVFAVPAGHSAMISIAQQPAQIGSNQSFITIQGQRMEVSQFVMP